MKNFKSKVIFQGGSIPVPSYLQKGTIKLENDIFSFKARGNEPRYDIEIEIPIRNILRARAEEKKYYSSVSYMLIIEYNDREGEKQDLELEIRSFVRRGRALAISRFWSEKLSSSSKD